MQESSLYARGGHAAPLAVALILSIPVAAAAQSAAAEVRYGEPIRLPVAEEIALARSAAPAAVSARATVLVLEEGAARWVVGEQGTSGATCYVSRTWPGSLEPHCFDPEGSNTILPIHLKTSEMGHAGATQAEIEAEIAAGVAAGRYRWPSRPAMSYMLSAGQVLVNDEGANVGAWKPHLMIYWPGLTKADLGGTGAGPLLGDSMILLDEGTDEACLIVVYPEWIEPAVRALYRRHAPALWRMALRLARGSEEEARDLVQETWIRAARRLSTFRWESALSTWLVSIALNCDRERRRGAGRETAVEDVEATAPAAVAVGAAAKPARVEPIDLARAIDALPDGYRRVLVLHDVEGYTHQEIGRLLGVEPGTSKSQLHRARARVRARLVTAEGGIR